MILPIEHTKPRRSRRPRSFRYRKKFDKVYEFKLSLVDIQPVIWRTIQVPDRYSFWDLHCAITDGLGWLDYHLHAFAISNPKTGEVETIGYPADDDFIEDDPTVPDRETSIADYFGEQSPAAHYEYDFGDSWDHSVVLEAILPREPGVVYPRCTAGERACPPEDCGGAGGYGRFLKAIADPEHEEHDRYLEWVGGWFDPDWFDIDLIRFGDPDQRWRIAYQDEPVPKSLRQVQYHQMRADCS